MLIPAAGAEVLSTKAIGLEFANLAQTPLNLDAVLTATGLDLLK